MSRIYAEASKVCVWIGARSELEEAEFVMQLEGPKPAFVMPKCIEDIYYRPYWDRLWIIQEVLLAAQAELYCGRVNVDLDTLLSLMRRYVDVLDFGGWTQLRGRKTLSKRCNAVKLMKQGRDGLQHLQNRTFALSLYSLMRQFERVRCTEARDQIFGLYSLVQKCCREAVPVDSACPPIALCHMILNHHYQHHFSEDLDAEAALGFSILRDSHELHWSLMEGSLCHMGTNTLAPRPLEVTMAGMIRQSWCWRHLGDVSLSLVAANCYVQGLEELEEFCYQLHHDPGFSLAWKDIVQALDLVGNSTRGLQGNQGSADESCIDAACQSGSAEKIIEDIIDRFNPLGVGLYRTSYITSLHALVEALDDTARPKDRIDSYIPSYSPSTDELQRLTADRQE
ncbi:hypothetical protein BDZ45DRAFT_745025 [Acephala macrosclerotiorum]|nr:hypothetical protein BDZ45DRAFT_745025 [Acephala macrosclerotiorum]